MELQNFNSLKKETTHFAKKQVGSTMSILLSNAEANKDK